MTIIKTQINGCPFEIELGDGDAVEISDGTIVVKKAATDEAIPVYPSYPLYQQPWNPWWHPFQPVVINQHTGSVTAMDTKDAVVTFGNDAMTFALAPSEIN